MEGRRLYPTVREQIKMEILRKNPTIDKGKLEDEITKELNLRIQRRLAPDL